jgi:hypothetical protein
MSRLQLRGFSAAESTRLGELIARARQSTLTASEGRELVDLLNRAEDVSRHNLRKMRTLRGDAPVQPKKHGRSYAKSS